MRTALSRISSRLKDFIADKTMHNILIISLLLLLILVVVFINYATVTATAIKKTEDDLEASALDDARTLDAVLKGQTEILTVFAASLSIQNKIDINNALTRLKAIVRDSSFMLCSYITPDGMAHFTNGKAVNVSDRYYFQQVMAGGTAVAKVRNSRVTNTPRIMIVVPVKKDGKVIGAVFGGYDEDRLRRILMPNIKKQDTYSFICDANGDSIISPTKGGSRLTENDNLFSHINDKQMLNGRTVQDIKKDFAEGKNGTFVYSPRRHMAQPLYRL